MKLRAMIFVAVAAILFSGLESPAQRKLQMKDSPEMKELRTKMHDYKQKNIHPEMLKWKTKLDNALSSEDLKKLNELRSQAATLRSSCQKPLDRIMMRRKKGGKGQDQGDIAPKTDKNQCRDDFREIAQQVMPLAEKYSSTLELIREEAKTKSEQWREDFKKIADEVKSSKTENTESESRRRGARQGDRGQKMGRQHLDFSNQRAVIWFMLWDGKNQPPREAGFGSQESDMEFTGFDNLDIPGIGSFSYPNPFTDKVKISFSLSKSQNVNLVIVDNSGNTVATLYDGQLKPGEHTFEFDAAKADTKLSPGTYIYKLKVGNETESGKMILAK